MCENTAGTGNSAPTAILQGAPFAGAAQCTGAPITSPFGTVTVTRASQAYCPKSDGTFVLSAVDTPRVGRWGVLREGSATQLLTAPRDLSDISWVKTTMTCTLTATGAEGTANSASTCTATAGNGVALQALVAGSAQRAASFSLKRRTGTGTVSATTDNGATWCDFTTALSTAMANGCSWLRVSQRGDDMHDTAKICRAGCGALTQTIANPIVGIRIGTNGDAVDVDFAQLEVNSYATTPMVGSSRSADVVSVAWTPTWTVASASAAFQARFTPMWGYSPAFDYRVGFDSRNGSGIGPNRIYAYQAGGSMTYGVGNNTGVDNTTTTTTATDIPFGKPRTWRVEWTPTTMAFRLNGVVLKSSAQTHPPQAVSTITTQLGGLYDGSTLWAYGFLSDIKPEVAADTSTAVATIGDSILVGAYDVLVGDAMQVALGGASSKYVTPWAVSGHTTATCTTDYTTNVQGKSYDVVVYNCGINNLLGGGETDTVAWGKMQTLLNTIVADGFRPVVANLLPCKGYASCNGTVQGYVTSVNASLAAWCAANPTAICVNTNLLMRNPADTDSMLPAYSSGADFLHPNNAGTIVYANALAGAVP